MRSSEASTANGLIASIDTNRFRTIFWSWLVVIGMILICQTKNGGVSTHIIPIANLGLPELLKPAPSKEVLIFNFLMFTSIESLCVCEQHPFHPMRIKVDAFGAKSDIHEIRKMHLDSMLSFIRG